MAWTAPRTWSHGETITSTIMNTDVRDNLNLLKTFIRDTGKQCNQVKSFGFSAGQGNAAGGAPTELTSYTWTLPGKTLSRQGSTLTIEMLWVQGAAAGTYTAGIQFGSTTRYDFIGSGAANTLPVVRMSAGRRSGTDGGIYHGTAWLGAGGGGAATMYTFATGFGGGGSIDWNANQTVKLYAAGTTANNLVLAYVNFDIWGNVAGAG